MKILKDNINNVKFDEEQNIFPLKVECEHCGSELEIERGDVTEGYLGQHCVVCPVCGKKTYDGIEEFYPEEKLTLDRLKFPTHFYSFADAQSVSSDRIKAEIVRAIEFFREEPESFCYMTNYGDMSIVVLNFSGDKEYSITVCNKNGVFETELPYEEYDYAVQASIDWGWTNSPTSNVGVKKKKKEKETKITY